jgi:SpoVK/Ycf46/Vps4 family AAA+-type ATPase
VFFFLLFVSAAFIRVVGSEFVQKYLGEGPRMVRDVFRLAKGMNLSSIDSIIIKITLRKCSCYYFYR